MDAVTMPALRLWQQECLDDLDEAFERKSDFLAVATPGGGKTKVALTFARKMVERGRIDHVHIIAPTRPLRHHWQNQAHQYGLQIRKRDNQSLKNGDLPFDIGGVVATYSQVAGEPSAHAAAIANKRALVIIDECHHAGDERTWGDGIKDAFDGAAFRLLLSGTPFRHDGMRITGIRYDTRGVSIPDYTYSYKRAMQEDVCRPIAFNHYDALVGYQHKGQSFQAQFSDNMRPDEMSALLRHALHPDAGLIEHMVRDADEELSAIRARGRRTADAAGLLIAMNQAHAHACGDVVRRVTGETPVIVVSDSESADDDLDAFRDGFGRWIVAVRKVSEGVDIPRLMVEVYATNVIKTLFFRQAIGRIVRVRHRGQQELASMYLPADERLRAEAAAIEDEVKQFLKDAPPDQYPSLRRKGGGGQVSEVPTSLRIGDKYRVYRGVLFSQEDLDFAEKRRSFFPDGDKYEAIQIAYTLYELGIGGGCVASEGQEDAA